MMLLSGKLQTSTPETHACLRCELGTFVLWDERLADMPAGDYDGFFEIEQIKPHFMPSQEGVMQVGMIAYLKRFSLTLLDQPKKTAMKPSRPLSVNRAQLSLFTAEEVNSSADSNKNESLDLAVEPVLSDSSVCVATTTVVEDSPEESHEEPVGASLSEKSEATLRVKPVVDITAVDKALFGEHFTLSETMKLDATESREVLRQQRNRLQELGYRFYVAQQVWRRSPPQ